MQLPVSTVWVGGRERRREQGGRPDGRPAVQDAVSEHHLVLFIKAIWLKQESKYSIKEAVTDSRAQDWSTYKETTAQLRGMSDELWISH